VSPCQSDGRGFESRRARTQLVELGSYFPVTGMAASRWRVLGLMAVLGHMLSKRVIKAAMARASGSAGLAMPLRSWTRTCAMTAPVM
jgi:hypothetical protein